MKNLKGNSWLLPVVIVEAAMQQQGNRRKRCRIDDSAFIMGSEYLLTVDSRFEEIRLNN
ncbi:hypothetical protein [Pedobacter sp. WC2423]|uniref:hypothetical protein n=1 Tax=Pedobacter sp. WC2423 TaxID=3234142 RepID=UPI003466DF7F